MAGFVLAALLVAPCIWDRDTLSDELRGIPDAHRLIVGRFVQHGDAYYAARVARLGERSGLDLAEYDDLGVAYERLGDRTLAIEVMARKAEALATTPDAEHQYRYHANLGTFLAHDGRLAEGIVELERAVELKPDAHFGREPYQIELLRYVLAARDDPTLWARESFFTWMGLARFSLVGFAVEGTRSFGSRNRRTPPAGIDPDRAQEALAGMLRFGGLEGPELYRSLGDWYAQEQHLNLAWWAWQRALERGHPARDALRAAIARIDEHWREAAANRGSAPSLAPADFQAGRANADAWLEAFHAAEERALTAGDDPGETATLARLVAEADAAVPALRVAGDVQRSPRTFLYLFGLGLLALAALLAYRRSRYA